MVCLRNVVHFAESCGCWSRLSPLAMTPIIYLPPIFRRKDLIWRRDGTTTSSFQKQLRRFVAEGLRARLLPAKPEGIPLEEERNAAFQGVPLTYDVAGARWTLNKVAAFASNCKSGKGLSLR